MASKAVELEVPNGGRTRRVRLSSPERLIWPQAGITKKDLARYVVAVGDVLLAALVDRPVTLQRFPDGTTGEAFYSKNPPRGVPAWARSVPVTYPSGRSHPQLVVDEVATAVWSVQMGTVTWHPWPVRTGAPDNPDQMRIDLDPQPGRGFPDAVEAATGLREVLADVGLVGWPKTSGNRGVHVDVVIAPEHEFLVVRHAVIALARELERRMPDLVTTAWWKEERGQRVFVDYNQAARDRTTASAYSPRPLPHAPVSFPLTWAELCEVDPARFTVRTVPELVASRADPRAGMSGGTGDLGPLLSWWQRDLEDGLGELVFPPDYPKMPGEPSRVQPSRARPSPEPLD